MIRRHLTPSLLISLLALFIATSGASYAALQIPKRSVGTVNLKNSAVTSKKVKDGTLKATDFKKGQLPAGATGPQGPAGPAGPTGPVGPSGLTAAYRVDGAANFVLNANFQPVLSLKLPVGNYVVTSRANLRSTVSASDVICSLGKDAAQNVSVDKDKLVTITQVTTLSLKSPGTIPLNCMRQNPGGTVTVFQRSITAIAVSEINEQ